jgi:RNA polymerase sigma factor (TIGR02999 family)
VDWQGRTHFLAVAAGAIRRILIDHARTRRRLKRGGAWRRVSLEDVLLGRKTKEVDFSELNSALDELAKLDADQAVIVELRFFGGLTVDEVAHLLGVSKRKVEGDWTHAKAWLRTQLAKAASE